MQFNKTERMNGERASNESTNGKSLRRNGMPENFVRLHTNTVTDVRDVNTEREREQEKPSNILLYEFRSLFFWFCVACFEISTFFVLLQQNSKRHLK